MDFSYTPEQEAFRFEAARMAREDLGRSLRTRGDGDRRLDRQPARRRRRRDAGSELREYHRRLYDAGYVALHWPKEWGGGGATLIEQAIYQDEVLRLGLPLYGANQLAIDRIGPTLMLLGTEEQKKRYLAQDADRRGDLVPGLLRAQRRLRSGGPADPRRARRRLLRGQRAEGVDQPRASRRHGRCCWCAPTPPRPSTRASPICWST